MRKSNNVCKMLLIMTLVGNLLVGCGTEKNPNLEETGNKKDTENGLSVFDVQEGRLVNYFGEEIVVSLPETVSEVASNAFRDSKTKIESITVGKNVTHISEDAFEGMENLSAVKVAEGNTHYSSSGNFLASNDGSTLFMFGTEKFETAIFDFADAVGAQKFCEDGFKVVFGYAVLHFDDTTNGDFRTSNCSLERIEAFGKSLDLNTNFSGNHAVTIQYAEDSLLITDYTYGVGDTYIIAEEGIWEQHNDEVLSAENCNDPIVSVSVDADGKLIFSCKPRKYVFTGSIGDLLVYSSGRDEIYSIEGILYFDGKYPHYTIEKKTVLSENYTENQLNDEFEAMNSFYEQFNPQSKYETINELFDENMNKHGVFEWIE